MSAARENEDDENNFRVSLQEANTIAAESMPTCTLQELNEARQQIEVLQSIAGQTSSHEAVEISIINNSVNHLKKLFAVNDDECGSAKIYNVISKMKKGVSVKDIAHRLTLNTKKMSVEDETDAVLRETGQKVTGDDQQLNAQQQDLFNLTMEYLESPERPASFHRLIHGICFTVYIVIMCAMLIVVVLTMLLM